MPDEVQVWRVGLDVPHETSAGLCAWLTDEERKRSAQLRFERDRSRFIVAHGLLHELMARYLETRPDCIRFAYNVFGKPRLHARFGSRLEFNLSHSCGLALIAIATGAAVGVDLEYVRAQPDCSDIAQLVFSAAELGYLMALPSGLRTEAFFSCWTKKEAYLKARGEGLTIPPNSFSVPLTNDAEQMPIDFHLASNDVGAAKRWAMYSLNPASGYIGALAIEGTGWRLRQRWLEMPSS